MFGERRSEFGGPPPQTSPSENANGGKEIRIKIPAATEGIRLLRIGSAVRQKRQFPSSPLPVQPRRIYIMEDYD